MGELVGNKLQTALSFAARSILADVKNPTAADKREAMLQLFEIVDNASSRVLRRRLFKGNANSLVLATLPSQKIIGHTGQNRKPGSVSPKRKPAKKDSSVMLTNAVYDSLMLCLYSDGLAQDMADILQDEWIDGDSIRSRCPKKNSRTLSRGRRVLHGGHRNIFRRARREEPNIQDSCRKDNRAWKIPQN